MTACLYPADIITAARSWCGTSFAHQGRLKKTDRHTGGVDCIGLVVGVSRELGLCDADGVPLHTHDRADYGRNAAGKRLYDGLCCYLNASDTPEPVEASVGLFRLKGHERHVGIFGERNGALTLIHAHRRAGKVEEAAFSGYWEKALSGVYLLPEVHYG